MKTQVFHLQINVEFFAYTLTSISGSLDDKSAN